MKSLTLIVGSFCLLACGSTNTSAVRYDTHTAGALNEPRTKLELEDRVAEACDLPRGTTYFAYGSTELDQMDDHALSTIATCMMTGKLKHADVIVIGYADARGTVDANQDLGMTRAESVADALVKSGVASTRLFIKSYGEVKASDKQTELDWAYDRKVTLRIAEVE